MAQKDTLGAGWGWAAFKTDPCGFVSLPKHSRDTASMDPCIDGEMPPSKPPNFTSGYSKSQKPKTHKNPKTKTQDKPATQDLSTPLRGAGAKQVTTPKATAQNIHFLPVPHLHLGQGRAF